MLLSSWNDRWLAFAQGIAVALGVNSWVSLVLLPGLFVGAFSSAGALLLALFPLGLLFYGIYRRNEVVLLFGFPSALLVPIANEASMATLQVYGPVRFAIVCIGLVGFLFGASTLTSFSEPKSPLHIRPLKSSLAPVSLRWRRRFRMYAALSILSVIYPAVLLYYINFDKLGSQFLSESYPGRAATFTTLLNVAAIGLWLWLFWNYILGALKLHRTGDRPLQQDLARLRGKLSRTRPQIFFYLGSLIAVVLLALWLAWRF